MIAQGGAPDKGAVDNVFKDQSPETSTYATAEKDTNLIFPRPSVQTDNVDAKPVEEPFLLANHWKSGRKVTNF